MGGRGSGSGFRASGDAASAMRAAAASATITETPAERTTSETASEGRTPYDDAPERARAAHQREYLRGAAKEDGKDLTDAEVRAIILESRNNVASTQHAYSLGRLEAIARVGDTLSSMEDNRWHRIEQTMTRTATGWRFTRTNLGTGEVYADTERSGSVAAGDFFNDHDQEVWRIKRKVAR